MQSIFSPEVRGKVQRGSVPQESGGGPGRGNKGKMGFQGVEEPRYWMESGVGRGRKAPLRLTGDKQEWGASPVPCPGHTPFLLPTLMQKVVLVLDSAQIPGTDPQGLLPWSTLSQDTVFQGQARGGGLSSVCPAQG